MIVPEFFDDKIEGHGPSAVDPREIVWHAQSPTEIAAQILAAPLGTPVDSRGDHLVIVARHGLFDLQSGRQGRYLDGSCTEAVLTGDGRHYDSSGWHQGVESEPVYMERWTAAGRVSHGWIDSRSRRLVQAG
jgi:hypothetical protein